MNSGLINRILVRMYTGLDTGIGTNPSYKKTMWDNYGAIICQITDYFPKTYNPAIIAAIVKCGLVYNKESVKNFCRKLSGYHFEKEGDPVKLLWTYIAKKKGKLTSQDLYSKTLTACKAHCENRTLSDLHLSKKDIFQWDEKYLVPLKEIKSQNTFPVGVSPPVEWQEPKRKQQKSKIKTPKPKIQVSKLESQKDGICENGSCEFPAVVIMGESNVCGNCFINIKKIPIRQNWHSQVS